MNEQVAEPWIRCLKDRCLINKITGLYLKSAKLWCFGPTSLANSAKHFRLETGPVHPCSVIPIRVAVYRYRIPGVGIHPLNSASLLEILNLRADNSIYLQN